MKKNQGTNWTKNLRVVKSRPATGAPAPTSQFDILKGLLLGTLKGGALRLKQSNLPIQLKSLRTMAAQIGKKAKATSHVLADGDYYTMWLEAGASKATARPNNGKPKTTRKRVAMTSATKPQPSTATPLAAAAEADLPVGDEAPVESAEPIPVLT